MNVHSIGKLSLLGLVAILWLAVGPGKAQAAPPPPEPGIAAPAKAEADDGAEVLTRGPVHEAFAETVPLNPEPGIVAKKAPPAAIEEVPPDERPDGDNVAWIPGYWAWDDDRTDFLWISGIWRALPPGRQWVPGYWNKTTEGYQWISGYWANSKTDEVELLPEPPATVEAGPNVAAPSEDHVWLPGCWMWRESRYAWRPGFWTVAQPDWIWVPAHYVWTPRGYIFVGGYWDYVVARRGVLFAPVYFGPRYYVRPRPFFSPIVTIDVGVFSDCLFLRPRYHHYYFGDYYAVGYRGAGFHPWFSVYAGRHGYDPFYAHSHWAHRHEPDWDRHHETDFRYRREHEDARPPRTWAMQKEMQKRPIQPGMKRPVVGVPLNDLAKHEGPVKFKPVDKTEQQHFKQQGQDIGKFRDQRQQLDASAHGPVVGKTIPKDFKPGKVKMPGSPVMAKPITDVGKKTIPPKAGLTPKTDVMPKGGTTPKSGITPKGGVTPKGGATPMTGIMPKSDANVVPKTGTKSPPLKKDQPDVKRQSPKTERLESGSKSPPPKTERLESGSKLPPPASRQIDRPATQRQSTSRKADQPPPQRSRDDSGARQDRSKGGNKNKDDNR